MELKPALYQQLKYPIVVGLMLFGLVFSKWFLTVAEFLLVLAVFTDSNSRKRLLHSFTSPLVLSLTALFLLHAIGLLWTDDLGYAAKDLKNKVPILFFPILFFAAGTLKADTARKLLLLFAAMVLLLPVLTTIYHLLYPNSGNVVAYGQSHIRFSLLICLAIFFILFFRNQSGKIIKVASIPAIGLLLYFLFKLESFTGYIVGFLMLFFVPVLFWKKIKSVLIRTLILAMPIAITAVAIWGYLNVKNNCYPTLEKVDYTKLDKMSAQGSLYSFDKNIHLSENGHEIYIYIAEKEMISAWNKRSSHKLESSQYNKTNILMRYLTSKGLRKDSMGVYALSDNDIRNIEKGYTNFLQPQFDPYRDRIYRFLWELSVYHENNDPSGHSLTQRFEYWKAALRIIEKHPFFGTGTGDISNAFKTEYDLMQSKLKPEFRLRAHNQFLSITVAFGLFGLLVFIYVLLSPFVLKKIPNIRLYSGFIFIFLLSLLNEDTLETQVGVTFYALFNSFLLLMFPETKKEAEK